MSPDVEYKITRIKGSTPEYNPEVVLGILLKVPAETYYKQNVTVISTWRLTEEQLDIVRKGGYDLTPLDQENTPAGNKK
jgi:hypothetical protein